MSTVCALLRPVGCHGDPTTTLINYASPSFLTVPPGVRCLRAEPCCARWAGSDTCCTRSLPAGPWTTEWATEWTAGVKTLKVTARAKTQAPGQQPHMLSSRAPSLGESKVREPPSRSELRGAHVTVALALLRCSPGSQKEVRLHGFTQVRLFLLDASTSRPYSASK